LPKEITLAEEKKKIVELKNDENEFELMLRFFGNEILAIKLAASNFNGKLIMWAMVIMFFTFMIMEVFGFSAWLGITSGEWE
tara:strand:- start:1222 stop:1467 length:246 start_codon:yes stop_codon:yes gene_type:complete